MFSYQIFRRTGNFGELILVASLSYRPTKEEINSIMQEQSIVDETNIYVLELIDAYKWTREKIYHLGKK